MFTVCPKCALTLAVTAADLRAGQGYVRCGRCANVFNALLGLSEESAGGSTQPSQTPAPLPAPAAPAAAPAAASLAPAPVQMPAPAPAPPALRLIESPPPPAPPAASNATEVEEFRGTGTFETIVLEGDTFLQTEEMVPEEAFDDEVAAVSRRIAAAHDEQDEEIIDFSDTALQIAPAPAPDLRVGGAEAANDSMRSEPARRSVASESNVDEVIEQLTPERSGPGWKSVTAATLSALLLVVQAVHHWRNDLATHQALSGPLTHLYAALHQPLTPNWNLAAYDVRQLGASSDVSDLHTVHVRLSLSNHAPMAQAVPLLRVTLLDRYGKSLSAGELTPAQYLPPTMRTRQLLDAEQRIDTEVSVPDPTQQASSFELDVCVAAAGGGLRCASDGAAPGATGASS